MTNGEATQPFCFPITDALGHQHLRNINLVLFLSSTPENVRTDVSKLCIKINKATMKGSLAGSHMPSVSLECGSMAVVEMQERKRELGGEKGVSAP